MTKPILVLVACASPRARHVPELLEKLLAASWDAHVVATPAAVRGRFVDQPELEALSGHPVLSQYRVLGEESQLPRADAMVVCPATVNTINKWALGIADTLALGLLTEAVGFGIPLVAAPALNAAQEKHVRFGRSVQELREMGVEVLYGPGVYEPAEPGSGRRDYDWGLILNALPRLGD